MNSVKFRHRVNRNTLLYKYASLIECHYILLPLYTLTVGVHGVGVSDKWTKMNKGRGVSKSLKFGGRLLWMVPKKFSLATTTIR